MNLRSINDPKHWRDRAAELRSLAMVTVDDQTQDIMYRLADDYDKLADRTAERAAKPSPT
jgi:hypothetical protein